jgi:hypothetical protein
MMEDGIVLTATPEQLETVLRRATPYGDIPEARLLIAVIVQAWTDLVSGSRDCQANRESAREFFKSGEARKFAELAGIEADFLGSVYAQQEESFPG